MQDRLLRRVDAGLKDIIDGTRCLKTSLPLVVLAGGFGTRLRSLVSEVPKALAPIGQTPFLSLQIAQWKAQGIRSFVFLLYYQADQVISFIKQHQSDLLRDCDATWLIEPVPLGTGGAIAYAIQTLRLTGQFLLTNADTWLSAGVREIAAAGCPAISVVRASNASRYGQVRFEGSHRVTSFEEKGNVPGAGWINAGLYKLDAELFFGWDGKPFSLEQVVLEKLTNENRLNAVPLDVDFIDIGVPDDYLRFCEWEQKRRRGGLWG